MGELILFRPGPAKRRLRDLSRPMGAKILFFTGVRYERWIEPPTREDDVVDPNEGVSGARRGRKRRRV